MPFSGSVTVQTLVPRQQRTVTCAKEAVECLLEDWHLERCGRRYEAALQACMEALSGDLDGDVARSAFIEAAKASRVFVQETVANSGEEQWRARIWRRQQPTFGPPQQ